MGFFDFGGQALSAYMSYKSQEATNKASAHEADINRQWLAEMSNTAHQREVKDLIASGLNPVLSTGVGASTPGGSMPSLSAPGVAASDALSKSVSAFAARTAAKESVNTAKTVQQVNSAQAAKLQADTLKTLADAQATKGTLRYAIGGLIDDVTRNLKATSAKALSDLDFVSSRRQYA